MAIVVSERANRDLLELLEFHSEHDPRFARDLTDKLLRAAFSLASFPNRGAACAGTPGYQRIFESNHVIVYAVVDDDVVIVRFVHGARDIDALLSEES